MSDLKKTTEIVQRFLAEHDAVLKEIPAKAEALRDASNRVERSWSGSFAGWHGKMYFRDFSTPSIHERFSGEWGGINGIPDGWNEKEPEEVTAKIESLVGDNFSVEGFEKQISTLRKNAETLKREASIALSAVDMKNASA